MAGSRIGLRLSRAERVQTSFGMFCLDDLLSADHRARQVWAYVEGSDLGALYDRIRAVDGGAGRAPIDPAILMALWLYATLESVGSARLLARLCESDAAYRWICGGVGVNYHTLSDFRVEAGAVLDDLLTRSMAALVKTGIVNLSCLAVDGVRVRANAGASSFRSQSRLSQLHEMARQKVAELRAELDADPAASSKRSLERKLRAEQDRQKRIEEAQKAADAIEAERKQEAEKQRRRKLKKSKPARGSTTDASARVMSMADGGYRPAYNLQFKTDPKSKCVVGIEVTNKASDKGQLEASVEETERRYKVKATHLLADGGYAAKDDIERLHDREIEVFCPLPKSTGKLAPTQPRRGEGPGVIAWRERMGRHESAEIYKERFACERPHADARNRGLQRFLVRGMEKVKAVALWHITAYNFLQLQRLVPQEA